MIVSHARSSSDSSAMADLSAETASDVLKACIKLRGSSDIKQAFQEVVADIGELCGSEHCCILLTDTKKRKCSIFAESLREGSNLFPMSHYVDGFYPITETWPNTLAGSTCVIVKDESDMEKLRDQNPIWGASLEQAGVKTIVLFPLRHGGVVLGYMWALNFNVADVMKIKETLEVTTFFLASEIASYQLLNELEIVGNTLYANIWQTDLIAEIELPSGKVLRYIDFSKKAGEIRDRFPGVDVLNGIAYDGKDFWITGKLWPQIYKVKF